MPEPIIFQSGHSPQYCNWWFFGILIS